MRTSRFVLLLGLGLALGSCKELTQSDRPPEVTDHSSQNTGANPERTDFQMVPLKFASAEETAKFVNDFLEKASAAARKGDSLIRLVADPRTNSLLVQGPVNDLPLVLELVSKLDRKVQ